MSSSTNILLLGFAFSFLTPAAALPEPAADWVVATDTTVQLQSKIVLGDVIVRSGATLTLQGMTLQVGGKILVEPNARLALGPFAGLPTKLMPADVANGFWMQVEGRLESEGAPPTEITGLFGSGLDAAAGGPGGLQINDTATLRRLHLHDNEAGLLVKPGATLDLADSTLENNGFSAITSFGVLDIQRTTSKGSSITIMAKREGFDCPITVSDSDFAAYAGALQTNGCPVEVRRTKFDSGSTGMFLNGRTTVLVEDTTVSGYQSVGVYMESRMTVDLRRVTLDGQGSSKGGVKAMPDAVLRMEGTTIKGHTGDGVYMQDSEVHAANSTIVANGGYGMLLVRPTVIDLENVDFGLLDRPNAKGAVSRMAVTYVRAVDPQGNDQPDLFFEVLREGKQVFNGTAAQGALQAFFETYGLDPNGQPVPLGPARYRATHPLLPDPVEGDLDFGQPHLVIPLPAVPASVPEPEPEVDATSPAPAIGLALALAVAVSIVRRRRVGP